MSLCLPVDRVVWINRRVLKVHEWHAVLDQSKLEGALGRPLHTFGSFVAFPTVPMRAAVLMEGLAQAHAFA